MEENTKFDSSTFNAEDARKITETYEGRDMELSGILKIIERTCRRRGSNYVYCYCSEDIIAQLKTRGFNVQETGAYYKEDGFEYKISW